MKTKKVLLIPSAILCLAALAACGKGGQSRFANGFESPEFEEYFKIPSNVSNVSNEYGQYVYETALLNSALAKSSETTLQLAGSAAFFSSDDRNQAQVYDPTGVELDIKRISPFSSSSSIIYGKNVTKMYDDAVAMHTEQSYRSKTNSNGQTNISNETDLTYLTYLEKDATVIDKYNAYLLTKGTPSLLSNGQAVQKSGDEEIAYRTKIESEPMELEKIKVLIEREANMMMMKDFKLSIPLVGGGMGALSMLVTNCSLKPFDISERTNSVHLGGGVLSEVNFFYDNKNSIYASLAQTYQQGYVLSPMQAASRVLPATLNDAIPAYQNISMVAKFSLRNNQWYCDQAGTNTKIYVMKDENLKTYNTPHCLCSAYSCSKLNYNSCGNYGSVEKIEQEYSPTTYGVEVNIIDEDNKNNQQAYLYDSFSDSNLEHTGGIYDHTMTFKKLGYPIADNQRVFYGIFDFSEYENFEDEDSSYSTDNYSFNLSLKDRDGEKDDVELFAEEGAFVYFDSTCFDEEIEPFRLKVKETGCTYEFTIIFTIDDKGEFSTLDSLTIYSYSKESSPSGKITNM